MSSPSVIFCQVAEKEATLSITPPRSSEKKRGLAGRGHHYIRLQKNLFVSLWSPLFLIVFRFFFQIRNSLIT